MAHISVLMNEVLDSLNLNGDEVVLDGTVNGGGHALEISKKMNKDGVFIGVDQDATALEISSKKLVGLEPQIHLVHDNFRNIDVILSNLDLTHIDRLLLDLGWSSNQFENPQRGFSFMHDGPLLMTLSDNPEKSPFTAEQIINEWAEESLVDIFEAYGEERFSKRIASRIVEQREKTPITRTLELADLVDSCIPKKFQKKGIHPATKIFQALRIATNDEMGALHEVLEKSFQLLSSGGKMLIISFHSIEDRIVKRFFKKLKENGLAELETKKPIIATENELEENKRSRSAKLRVLIKK